MWWRTSNCSPLPIYRPREDERLSWPGWLTYSGRLTHISDYPSATGRAQDGERTPARDWRSTSEPREPTVMPQFVIFIQLFLPYFYTEALCGILFFRLGPVICLPNCKFLFWRYCLGSGGLWANTCILSSACWKLTACCIWNIFDQFSQLRHHKWKSVEVCVFEVGRLLRARHVD